MSVILIYGEAEYFAQKRLAKELDKAVYATYDLNEIAGINDIPELAGGMGLFSLADQKILLRNPFQTNAALQKDLVAALSAPLASEMEIVLYQRGKADKRTSLYKLIKKQYQLADYEKETTADKKGEIKSTLAAHSISISHEVAASLLDIVQEFDMLQIEIELKKLVTLVEARADNEVRSEDLAIISVGISAEVWELFNLAARSKPEAFRLLNKLLAQQVAVPMIIGFLASQLRALLQIRYGLPGLNPFVKRKMTGLASSVTPQKLELLIQKLAELDNAIKSGKVTPEIGVKLFLAIV